MDFNFAVIGGDKRNVELAKMLIQDGKIVYICGLDKLIEKDILECIEIGQLAKEVDIVIGPIPLSRDNITLNAKYSAKEISLDTILEVAKNKTLIAGNIAEEVIERCKANNINVIDIMKNEKLAILNTIATAEGTIEIAISNTQNTLSESKVLILGYGRVGKTLVNKMKNLVYKLDCATKEKNELALIQTNSGCNKMNLDDIEKYLDNYDIIINTIPAMVLDKEKIQKIRKDTLLIDLASNPGGIDKKEAISRQINVIHALGLPGKYAPRTSAKFIKEVIFEYINK